MITLVYGDIFYSPARVLVNPVNITGVMGAGLAKDYKRFFPPMFEQYRELCHADNFRIGQLLLYKTPHKWVLNMPTKRHWRAASTLEYIEDGLQKFAQTYADYGMTSISFPKLGTGEGGLDWGEVLPRMRAYLDPLPLSVFIHIMDVETPFMPEVRNTRAMRHWLNGQPQRVTFEHFWRDMLTAVCSADDLHTLESHESFRAVATDGSGRQRLSVKITPPRGESIFLPETQLRDLWQYVRRAGYVLPQNLPAGLEAYSAYIVALLAELPYVRPIQLASLDSAPVIGLHYIPPVIDQDEAFTVALD